MARRSPIKLEEFIRRRPRRVTLAWAVGLLVAAAAAWLERGGALRPEAADLERYDQKTFHVVHVVDGDTLDVDAPDGDHPTTRIRLWGVDAPEIAHPPHTTESQPFGQEATRFLHQRADGQTVRLILEPTRVRDRYGRLLAHVELPSGRLVTEDLLAGGLARADPRWKHRYIERFDRVEKQAKRDHVGMWGEAGR
ncbi:MAG: thermonuclease family protein [Planctomycetes bacterium]|nr:thermonuclease family protein [Planctomycetota bacterium]